MPTTTSPSPSSLTRRPRGLRRQRLQHLRRSRTRLSPRFAPRWAAPSRDLQRVEYSRLSGAGRLQYEQSSRFSQQAEAAIGGRNFVFAAILAEKAAVLAAELLGR